MANISKIKFNNVEYDIKDAKCRAELEALIGSDTLAGDVDTIKEIQAFLAGIDTDDPTLFNQLKSINDRIDAIEAVSGTIDDALSSTSINPVQNKVIKGALDSIGSNINTLSGEVVHTISVNGGSSVAPTNGNIDITIPSAAWADVKPSGGVPKSDLASGVQASLDKADAALQQSDLSGYATQEDVDDAVSTLVSSAPQTLDTLKELADALGDDPNFATTMATQLGNKVDKESGKSLMTDAERTKLQGIAAGAEVNVQPNWTQTNTSADDYIKNKPDLSTFATKTELNAKQDKINDLATIRSGAAKGATSVQTVSVNGASLSPTDGNISISAVTGLQFDGSSHVGAVQLPEYVKKSVYDTTIEDIYQSIPSDLADMADDATHRLVTDTEKNTWNGKQNAISDLATIRSGAAAGATALQPSDVSVETQGDGTVDINVKDDTYSINLNHTHEGMAKLVVCEESDLPSTLDNSTIYAITDSGETEIEKLIIRGMEFAGGGVPDTGEPMILSPSNGSTINLNNSDGTGVSKTITVKGKNLTGDLTVAVGTGLTISYGQSTGQSSITIPMAQALLGAQVTITYSGSGSLDDGSLVISQGNDVLSVVVVVVSELPNGYTRLEYVDNAVRGIDTGILATNSNVINDTALGSTWEVDVQCNSAPSDNMFIVCTNEDVGHWLQVRADVQKFAVGGEGMRLSTNVTERTVIVVSFYGNRISASAGGETVSRNYTYPNKYNVCLFRNVNPNAQQYAGFQFTGRVYSIKCTSGGSFDAIPAQRTSDGKKGLYDKANDVFYPLT